MLNQHSSSSPAQADGPQGPDPLARSQSFGRRSFGEGWRPNVRAIAPGRIELIGNHLDYNGGLVLAAAIDRFIVALRDDNGPPGSVVLVLADASPEPTTLDMDTAADWRNPADHIKPRDYGRAVIASLISRGHGCVDRARVVVSGDVPVGLGVSSSAALCVALTLALSSSDLSPQECVLVAQEAEHRAGTPCGTMDQSASVAGGVIRFDGATLGVEKLEPDLGSLTFVLADSGVDRSLGSSAYPRRVAESKQALQLANSALSLPLPHLAAMSSDQLNWLERQGVLAGDLLRRCRHVVTESWRVSEAERAMSREDWLSFGELMTASGRSSAADYEVSHPRVEELVGDILGASGVLGARMMGGGGGGSVLALVQEEAVDSLEERLTTGYFASYGLADRPGVVQRCKFGHAASIETAEE